MNLAAITKQATEGALMRVALITVSYRLIQIVQDALITVLNRLVPIVRVSTVVMGVLLIVGCVASTPREEIFSPATPTTEEIYYGASSSGTGALEVLTNFRGQSVSPEHYVANSEGDLAGYTREQDTEISNLFPEIPNRRLQLYVFPHLGADGSPIPGYTTSFYLYDQAQIFALPGETSAVGNWVRE